MQYSKSKLKSSPINFSDSISFTQNRIGFTLCQYWWCRHKFYEQISVDVVVCVCVCVNKVLVPVPVFRWNKHCRRSSSIISVTISSNKAANTKLWFWMCFFLLLFPLALSILSSFFFSHFLSVCVCVPPFHCICHTYLLHSFGGSSSSISISIKFVVCTFGRICRLYIISQWVFSSEKMASISFSVLFAHMSSFISYLAKAL